jgi:hypothetical protein
MESGSVDMLGPFFQKSSRENKKNWRVRRKYSLGIREGKV